MADGIYVVRNHAIDTYRARIETGVPRLVEQTLQRIDTQSKAAAPYKTGTLRRSITYGMTGRASGWVGSRNVPYARIQDLGGTTRPHIIRPRLRKALFWPGAAHPVPYVNHPGSTIPGNHYLTGTYQRNLERFNSELRALLRP